MLHSHFASTRFGCVDRLQRGLVLSFCALHLGEQQDRSRLPASDFDRRLCVLLGVRKIPQLDVRACEQLVGLAWIRRHRDFRVRNRVFRISRFQICEAESEREVG